MTSGPLGLLIAQRRKALGLSLKALVNQVRKEDGSGLAPQFIHDVEHGNRTPSEHMLGELARVLQVDIHTLRAMAGYCPRDVIEYLRERPDTAPAVAALFARARAAGFTDWERLILPSAVGVSQAH